MRHALRSRDRKGAPSARRARLDAPSRSRLRRCSVSERARVSVFYGGSTARGARGMTTVFIISAPSGSGKSTLVNHLMGSVADLMFSVSYTTRKPRGAEIDGQNYHF